MENTDSSLSLSLSLSVRTKLAGREPPSPPAECSQSDRERSVGKLSGVNSPHSFLSQTWRGVEVSVIKSDTFPEWEQSQYSIETILSELLTRHHTMSVSLLVRPIQETLLARQGAAAALSGLANGEQANTNIIIFSLGRLYFLLIYSNILYTYNYHSQYVMF